ncbi:MAG: iron-sulfur cluster assembly accessory protein [Alphaproteobacteria bacterium]|nr:iron-sulfur cluster assembly accessory protein [Alphaproteobacteria bacterium]
MPQAISITETAAKQVRTLLASRGKPSVGIRVGVKSGGCSGLSYTIEYADEKGQYDEVIDVAEGENGGGEAFKVLIDPKASLYLIGTTMDFVEEKMKSGFVFKNPNEKGRCGCGESFHV